jgi:ATP/maltotriose-dependent transcriptional regulator MalT
VLAAEPELPSLHARVADTLVARGASMLRVAAHRRAAGQLEAAAQALLAEADRLAVAHASHEAEAILGMLDADLGAAGPAARIDAQRIRGELANLRGDRDDSVAISTAALEAAESAGLAPLALRCRLQLGVVLRNSGQYPRAREELARVLMEARADGNAAIEAHALLAEGRRCLVTGAVDDAERALREARDIASRAGAAAVEVEAIGRLGDVWRLRGDQARAAACFEESAARHRANGNVAGESLQLHGLAEAQRLSGRLDEAEVGYRQCIAMSEALGRDASIPRFNLCLCLLARGRAADAESTLRALDARWADVVSNDMIAYTRTGILCAVAMRGDAAATDVALSEVRAALTRGTVDIDLAQLAGDAARAWAGRGDAVRAHACAEIAVAQWEALGRLEEAEALRAQIAAG